MIAPCAATSAPAEDDLPSAAHESYRLHRAGELPHAIETPEEAVLEGFFGRQLDFPAREGSEVHGLP